MTRQADAERTILMTADAVGGVWSYALTLCAALPRYRFVLAVMGPPPSAAQRDAAERLGNVVLEAETSRLEWMADGTADLPAARRRLAWLARYHECDLVHVNGYAHARLDVDCPVIAVAHSDVLSWWRAVHGEPAPAEWEPYRREVAAGLAAADRVVAPAHAVLDDLAREYGFARPDFTQADSLVIPNGIDLAAFAPAAKRPVIMAAGRAWDAAKNLGLLDTIAGDLPWRVEIAGPTYHPDGGVAQFAAARTLGTLTPPEMAEKLGNAVIFAAPARYEPFGLGILEAAASGCALVLGDIRSLREIWADAALFLPPRDASAWRDALKRLIGDPAERERLASAARARAVRLSRDRMARHYAALYRELLAEPRRPPRSAKVA